MDGVVSLYRWTGWTTCADARKIDADGRVVWAERKLLDVIKRECDEFVGDAVRTDSCEDDDPSPCCCAATCAPETGNTFWLRRNTYSLRIFLASDKYIYHAHHHFQAKSPLIPILKSPSKPLP